VLALLVVVTASIVYFIREYGIVIDVNTVRNTIETNQAEAADLLTGKLFASIAAFGILPAAAVAWLPVRWSQFTTLFKQNFKRSVVAAVVCAIAVGGFFAEFASFFREHRLVLHKLAPSNVVNAAAKYASIQFASAPGPVAAVATDAHKGPHWTSSARMLNIETEAFDSALDILSDCRPKAVGSSAFKGAKP
jgi:lipid A ethanolaminephosphotransferase